MIQNERDIRHEHVLDVARQMMTAARTAPKGKGVDIIEVALVTGDDVKVLSDKMVAMVEEHGMKFFLRDADNILSAEGIVLIGTHEQDIADMPLVPVVQKGCLVLSTASMSALLSVLPVPQQPICV